MDQKKNSIFDKSCRKGNYKEMTIQETISTVGEYLAAGAAFGAVWAAINNSRKFEQVSKEQIKMMWLQIEEMRKQNEPELRLSWDIDYIGKSILVRAINIKQVPIYIEKAQVVFRNMLNERLDKLVVIPRFDNCKRMLYDKKGDQCLLPGAKMNIRIYSHAFFYYLHRQKSVFHLLKENNTKDSSLALSVSLTDSLGKKYSLPISYQVSIIGGRLQYSCFDQNKRGSFFVDITPEDAKNLFMRSGLNA